MGERKRLMPGWRLIQLNSERAATIGEDVKGRRNKGLGKRPAQQIEMD
jgi:hypothetical protein